MAVKELWLENSIVFDATVIPIHNSAAQALPMNKQVSARSKHIDLYYSFVKDDSDSRIITLEDVPSADNATDMLTKIHLSLHYDALERQNSSSLLWPDQIFFLFFV